MKFYEEYISNNQLDSYTGNLQVYDIKDSALEEIFERITQDIFNETLAKW